MGFRATWHRLALAFRRLSSPRPSLAGVPGRPRRAATRLRAIVLVALAAVLLGGCSLAYPAAGGTVQGQDIRSLYDILLIPVVVIFVLVEGLLVWALLRYRGRRANLPHQTHGNNLLEITWTVIPTLIVLVVFALSMQTLGKVDAKSSDPALVVDVTGKQWFWDFSYPVQKVTVSGAGQEPVIDLPVGETILIRLHSDNVIHSFYVPGFLFKRDVIPGLGNQFDINITTPGIYRGQCAEFCGFGHADMRFSIQAVSQAEFASWIAGQQAAAAATPTPAPSLAAGATTLSVSASTTTGFEQSSLSVAAGKPFAVAFDDKEAGVPHDFAIKDSSGKVLFNTRIITGPASETATAPALPAGTYTFFCQVHPNMQGTLTVQ